MALYNLEFASSVRKDLKKIHKKEVKRILAKIEDLADEPRPDGAKKLTNEELYRIRIGNYRVIYEIFDDHLVVHVVKVGHR
ncbi:type II toxin-antitoxin system RelE/ParE family toxin [Pelagicoccus sp. SDUM812002]|uniref:type II toxin-antitoxin system RelE family toxin n=1 Tax=Pelagicoccus sp. SDUM812002 TaxID=3041266 RepID=UPI00281035A6|nr:type II toxin-antitoxin system RelE/ParE family toxin [Pelagicoccus sp. SDUM812002]MDQ8188458.1 type II toxin-antitoxin system RelE/ParE family toxin [Pelagicoccus sp. SDUM812002]